MASGGLIALLDDIVTILDDVAVLSKVAAKKTAGIAGDDLAVGAEQVAGGGIDPKRELPIVWEVAKGSLKNKAFLIPGALTLSAVAPWAIPPIMMAGGVFLCYEGVEKVLHAVHARKSKGADDAHHKAMVEAIQKSAEDLKALERQKIKKAINTDTILSAEIVVISLAAVAGATLAMQAATLAVIGVGMTAGIYGLVAGIVKLDDIGLRLTQMQGDGFLAKASRSIGLGMVSAAPPIMKTLSIVGTAAMFLVGGGILAHAVPALAAFHGIAGMAISAGVGIAAGFAALGATKVLAKPFNVCKEAVTKIFRPFRGKKESVAETNMPTAAPTVQPEAVAASLADTPALSETVNAAVSINLPAVPVKACPFLKPQDQAPKSP